MSFRGSRILCIGITLLALMSSTARAQAPRQSRLINTFWKYQQGDGSGWERAEADDSSWQSISLPHSFSMPYFLSQEFYMGYGWYRKQISLPNDTAAKRVAIEFEGVFQEAEVFVNGQAVGSHQGGYTGFSIDISKAIKPGDNLIAVRVNNNWNPRLAPRAGEHVFSGGIYRNVHLVFTDPLHVAWYGTFVTTPEVSAEKATVNVKTEVVNDSTSEKSATVRQTVLDPDGKSIAQAEVKQAIAAGKTQTLEITLPTINSPKLWSPDTPVLYSVKTTILDGDRITDECVSPLGFRWFKWTADQGFFLNGKHLYIRGANVHQDHAGWGDAMTDADVYRDVKMVKDAGFFFIRGSHYPHSPAFSAACDKLGILFWSENDFWATAGRSPEGYFDASGYPTRAEDQPQFEATTKAHLAEMIRIHRNHPSIVVWSMCNEPFFAANSVHAKVRAFLTALVEESHKLDPTRPAALGGVQRPINQNRMDKLGDIAGYNGDGASIAAFQNVGIPNIVSEYGTLTDDRPGRYDPRWGDLARTPGADRNNPDSWRFPWRSGEVIWCAFDHGTLASLDYGKMGIIDYFRIPKRSWYWYRNEYAKVPPPQWPEEGTPAGLKLEADKTQSIKTDGSDSTWLLVTVLDANGKPISNSPPVQFSIVSGPGEFPTGTSIDFANGTDIRIVDGLAAITFRSSYAGTTVIRATSPGLKPAEITLQFVGDVKWEEGKTPAVQPRPYTRYRRPNRANPPQTFGRNAPTFPSSAQDAHPGGHACDDDANSYWSPAESDSSPSIIIDNERFFTLSRARLTFVTAGIYQFKMEISDDQRDWKPVADLMKNDKSQSSFDIPGLEGASGRFVRITFTKTPNLRLSGVEFSGTMRN